MRSVQDVVTIDEAGLSSYTFSEVQLWRRASIAMSPGKQRKNLIINKLVGDRTGLIDAHANHTIQLEASATVHSVSKPAVNLRIDKDSEMVLGASVYVIGDGAKGLSQIPGDVSISVNGRLTNVNYFFLTKKLKARFSQNIQTAEKKNGSLVVSEVGKFVLAVLELQDGTELLFDHASGVRSSIGKLHMKYGSKIKADEYDVDATTMQLEAGSTVTASGGDRPNPNNGSIVSASCQGSGGSYGSYGGKGIFIYI